MKRFALICHKCGRIYHPDYRGWKCTCGGYLDIVFDLSVINIDKVFKSKGTGMWKFHELLPVDENFIVTLGEGNTPLVCKEYKGVKVYFKLEFLNPTGSFKDRGASVVISHVKELGFREVIEDSSGNAGVAIAAYSSVANIRCKIFVPYGAPKGKVAQILLYGGTVVRVKGTRKEVNRKALESLKEKTYYVGHLWNPYFVEGIKTIAYEVYEQMKKTPHFVILPIGSGGLVIGTYKGFHELKEFGKIEDIPKIIGVQVDYCAPAYEFLKKGEVKGEYIRVPETPLADGIVVPNPPRVDQICECIRKSNGDIILVNDKEIKNAIIELLRLGYLVEPTSACSFAALVKMINEGIIEKGDEVLLPLTGNGLKTINKLVKLLNIE